MSTRILSKETLLAHLPYLKILKELVPTQNQIAQANELIKQNLTFGNFLKALGFSVAGISLTYLIKIWWAYRFFKRRGIKTPKYRFISGNFPEIRKYCINILKNYSDIIREWTKQLGPTYGMFEGHYPILVTSDLEIIQEVFIKQTSNFSARKLGPITRDEDSPSTNLFFSSKMRWKRMRNIMNPTFSTAKLKELSPLLIQCVDRLDEKIKQSQNKEIYVGEFLKRFTMDSIWNVAFGIDINIQNDKTHEQYYLKCEQIFSEFLKFPTLFYAGVYFHEFKNQIAVFTIGLYRLASWLGAIKDQIAFVWLAQQVHQIVESRKQSKKSRNDYLKLLIDAETSGQINDQSVKDLTFSSTHVEKKLTFDEIKSNLVMFMVAGYETTSTTLTYCCFVLARYPEEQENLYNEIINYFPEDSKAEPEVDTIQQCIYLDMFVKETLRMYPIGSSGVSRRCTKRTTIKGIDMPEDLIVAVDVMSLHYSEELWGPVDPNEFYPKRHLPECKRNPLAFMGFGAGPRNCVGMKFAYQEIKYALIKLLKKYEIVAGPNTPEKLDIVEGLVRTPRNGLPVVFKIRQNFA